MGKITYSYNSYPNCPEATEYSKSRASTAAQLGGIVGFASLGAVFGLVYTASEFFSKNNWSDFIGGIVFAIFMAAIDFYFFVARSIITEREIKKILIKSANPNLDPNYFEQICNELQKESRDQILPIAKKYFGWFFFGMIALIVLIGAWKELF